MIEVEGNPRWLRVREAARVLNVSESTARRWLSRGKLEGLKVDGVVRVDGHSIEKLPRTHRYADVRKAQRSAALSRWSRLQAGWLK
jgi:excisionase family DNA binding protein